MEISNQSPQFQEGVEKAYLANEAFDQASDTTSARETRQVAAERFNTLSDEVGDLIGPSSFEVEEISGVAVESPATENRLYIWEGQEGISTNLPEGYDPFEHDEHDFPSHINPNEVDAMSVGIYTVSKGEKPTGGRRRPGSSPTYLMTSITVSPTEYGKAVDASLLPNKPKIKGETVELLASLGYIIEGESIVGIPTPESVVQAAKKLGVEVELLRDARKISGETYLGVFKEGKYPIATKMAGMYLHDIDDDHLTAMVLGGEPLKEALMRVAEKALESKDSTIIERTASNVDSFTAILRGVVAYSSDQSGEAFNEKNARSTLYGAAELVGLTSEEAELILKYAQQRADEFGMTPKLLQ